MTADNARYILAGVAIVNSWLFSGGLIYGWGDIHTSLLNEQQFRDNDCPKDPQEKCHIQEVRLEWIFLTSFISLSVLSMIFGLLVDKIGPRFTTILGLIIAAIGNVIFAYSQWDSFNGFSVGFAMIAGGGIAPFICHFNFANLFEQKAIFVGSINAMFNVSGFNYLVFGILDDRKTFFLIYAVLCVFGVIAAFLCYPDRVYQDGDKCSLPISRICGNAAETPRQHSGELDALLPDKKEEGFRYHALSQPFIWLVIWYSISLIVLSFMSTAVADVLGSYSERPKVGGKDLFAQILFPVISNAAFIFAPMCGYLIGHYGFSSAFFLVNVTTSLLLLCCIAPKSWTIWFQITTFFWSAAQKGLLFTTFYTFLGFEFPIAINGRLISVATGVAAVVGTVVYGLVPLAQNTFHGDYLYINLILLVVSLPCYYISVVASRPQVRQELVSVLPDDYK